MFVEPKNKRERVVVTGLGAISGLGHSAKESFEALLRGVSPVGRINIFDTSTWAYQWGICVADFEKVWNQQVKTLKMHKGSKHLNRETALGVYAALQAAEDAGLHEVGRDLDGGVFAGGSNAGFRPQDVVDLLEGFELDPNNLVNLGKFFEDVLVQERLKLFDRTQSPCFLARVLAEEFRLNQGYVTIETACAGGSQAIGMGFEAIANREMSYAFCVAADSMMSEFVFASFCKLGVMLPYDSHLDPKTLVKALNEDRKGFVPGEGGVCLVLESYEHAKDRGAKIYAEILGHGESSSAYRVTDMPPDGRGPKQAMTCALDQAGISCFDLDYINLHGTGTLQNDKVEVGILNQFVEDNRLGKNKVIEAEKKVYVGSTKPLSGHLVSAAGAIEAMFTILSLNRKILAPNINLNRPLYLENPFEYCSDKSMSHKKLRYGLSNSFGFGGINSTLIFQSVEL